MPGRLIVGKCLTALAVVALVVTSVPGAAQAKDSYYMLIFSQQAKGNAAPLSHTFATFVKAPGEGKQAGERLEVHTISWMPASLNVKLVKRSEPGVNLDLKKTLELARSRNARVSIWGPYQIDGELYDKAVERETFLKSGTVEYKAVDTRARPVEEGKKGVSDRRPLRKIAAKPVKLATKPINGRGRSEAINCIHAVSGIDTSNGPLETRTAHGDEASYMVLLHLRRWISDRDQVHAWLVGALGLDNQPIARRTLEREPGRKPEPRRK